MRELVIRTLTAPSCHRTPRRRVSAAFGGRSAPSVRSDHGAYGAARRLTTARPRAGRQLLEQLLFALAASAQLGLQLPLGARCPLALGVKRSIQQRPRLAPRTSARSARGQTPRLRDAAARHRKRALHRACRDTGRGAADAPPLALTESAAEALRNAARGILGPDGCASSGWQATKTSSGPLESTDNVPCRPAATSEG